MQDMLCDGVTNDLPKLWQSRILCGSAQAYAVLSDPEPPFTHEANIPPECMYKNSLLEESSYICATLAIHQLNPFDLVSDEVVACFQ